MSGRGFGHATLGFALCVLLFFTYLFALGTKPLPVLFYWVPLVGAVAILLWQSTQVRDKPIRARIALSEVLALGFVAHMVFVIPINAGVFGRDIFTDLAATDAIATHGWPIPANVPLLSLTRTVSEWPLLSIFGMTSSRILGIELFNASDPNNVLRWLPSAVSIATPLFWYSIARRICGREDVSLISSLASTLVFYNVMFHAWFVEETIAYLLLFAFVLCFVISVIDKKSSTGSRTLAIILLIALAFAHHLTLFFALLFLLIAFAIPQLLSLATLAGRRTQRNGHGVLLPGASGMFLVAVIIFVSYMTYIGEPVVRLLASSMSELFRANVVLVVRRTGGVLSTDRILLFLRLALGVTFSSIIFFRLLHKPKTLFWDILGLLWGVGAGVITALDQLLIMATDVGVLRMEGFAWPLVLIPTSLALLSSKSPKRGVALVAVFIMVNLVTIPAYVYNPGATPQYALGESSMRYTAAEYSATEWFHGDGTILGDVTTYELFGAIKQLNVVTDFQVFNGNLTGVGRYQWLVLRQENYHVVTAPPPSQEVTSVSVRVGELFNTSPTMSKIYSNGDVDIFYVTPG